MSTILTALLVSLATGCGLVAAGIVLTAIYRHFAPLPAPPLLEPGWDMAPQFTVVCIDCGRRVSGPVDLQAAILHRTVSHGLCPNCLADRQRELAVVAKLCHSDQLTH